MSRNFEAGAKFIKILKDKNFLTPEILNYGFKGKYIWELSKGDGLTGGKIYGVTVVNHITKKHEIELCECFRSLTSAHNYIEALSSK